MSRAARKELEQKELAALIASLPILEAELIETKRIKFKDMHRFDYDSSDYSALIDTYISGVMAKNFPDSAVDEVEEHRRRGVTHMKYGLDMDSCILEGCKEKFGIGLAQLPPPPPVAVPDGAVGPLEEQGGGLLVCEWEFSRAQF